MGKPQAESKEEEAESKGTSIKTFPFLDFITYILHSRFKQF